MLKRLLLVTVALLGALVGAQMPDPPQMRLELTDAKPFAGETVRGTLTVSLAQGLHAYQNPPSDPTNIPLTVAAAGGTQLVSVQYPKGKDKPFLGYETPLAIYEGQVRIPVTLRAPTAEGPASFKLSVKVQLCDDTSCYPPQTVEVAATATVQRKVSAMAVGSAAAPPVEPAQVKSGEALEIVSFFAGSSSVPTGSTVLLSWTTNGAATAAIRTQDGETPVAAKTGVQKYTVAGDTTFTLVARGPDGAETTRDVTVKATPAPGTMVEASVQPGSGLDEPVSSDQPVGTNGTKPEPTVQPGSAASASATPEGDVEHAKKRGLLAYVLLAFLAGIAALATPCVWPMIPITVSFFSKRGESGKKDVPGATAYSLGIIGTFTGLGVLTAVLFGATGLQRLAANPWVNFGLAALFIVLAASLFGVFEIGLPSAWVNKAQGGTKKQGLAGPVAMGTVFTLTSFTCTVPFVGALLFSAAQGDLFYPIVGMLAFSLAFALPFFFLALFPQYLASLPRSGAWLADVKAYMGFLEIAAAVKFLSNVDLTLQLGALTKPAFLAVWVTLFAVAGLWLLGWVRLPHLEATAVGWKRRVFGVFNVALAGYLLAAMNGAPLGQLSGFLPPEPYPGREGQAGAQAHGGIPWVFSYEDALAKAKAENKPVFLNFTGDTCVNCRYMENAVFPDPSVQPLILETVPVWLVTDRETDESRRLAKLREELTKSVANPVYVVLKPDGSVSTILPGSTQGPGPFRDWLKEGLETAR
jgi:thiol:disulfide interchange protein